MPDSGHNNPPSLIEHANETSNALNEWLSANPVVQTEEQAREGKLLHDRAKDATTEMENERAALVRPLNEQVKAINDRYREPGHALERILAVLVTRLDNFARAEEQRRIALADEAAKRLADAEAAARSAESAEKDAIDAADAGTLDIDVASVTSQADAAFDLYKLAQRESALAQREAKVKIGGGFRRNLSLRNKETLEVSDWSEAIAFLGLTDKIRDAILTEARAFRKEFDELPPGVTAKYDRSL